jgi:hypothetical protein
MTELASPAVFQAAREELARRRAEKTAEYENAMRELDAALAEIEMAEKVFQKWSGPTLDNSETTGADELGEEQGDLAGSDNDATYFPTHKELVLEAIRRLDMSPGAIRSDIYRFIQEEYGVSVPLPSISTYLARLKRDGLIEVDNAMWRPLK